MGRLQLNRYLSAVVLMVGLTAGHVVAQRANGMGVRVNGVESQSNAGIAMPNGVVGAPSLTFALDTTTGVYRAIAGAQMNIAVLGVETVRFTAASGYTWIKNNQMLLGPAGQTFGLATDGLIQYTGSAQTFGDELNVGTAIPTSTCGVSADSNNSVGTITATAVTTCTVTFGTPNWSHIPRCFASDRTTLQAARFSAISAAAFTVLGLTSGDVFDYFCIGVK